MDEHRFGLSPEEDGPVEPEANAQPAAPTGEPASTLPPEQGTAEPAAAAPAMPNQPEVEPGDAAGSGEPPRPPMPFFAEPSSTPPASSNVAGLELATYGSRVVGYLLDGLILFAAAMAVLGVCRLLLGPSRWQGPSMVIGGYLLPFSYATYLISRSGQTVGMRVAKVRCAMADGSELTTGRAAGRSAMALVMGIIPYVGSIIDLLFPVWDAKRQTVHDKAAGTVVVKVVAVPDFPPPLG